MDLSQRATDLISQFQVLQEAREYSYRIFQEGHKIYLSSSPEYDFVQFRALVAGVTRDFKDVSEGVINIEKQLRSELGQISLADHVAFVQNAEKKKLELTAQLQLSLQARQDHPGQKDIPLQVTSLKSQLHQLNEHIQKELQKIRYENQELNA